MLNAVTVLIFAMMNGTSEAEDQDRDAIMRAAEAKLCSLEYGQTLVKERPAEDLLDWKFEELPHGIQFDMYDILGASLAYGAHPQRQTKRVNHIHVGENIQVRVFAARQPGEDDLVEYRWKVDGGEMRARAARSDPPTIVVSPPGADGQELRAIASRNALKLDIALDTVDACGQRGQDDRRCAEQAESLVSGIMKLKGRDTSRVEYAVELPWPDSLADGVSLSSAPEQNLLRIGHWSRRVDAFVENGTLSILIYKKIPQLQDYLDGSQWFDDDFRQLVHERAREQGKEPREGPAFTEQSD